MLENKKSITTDNIETTKSLFGPFDANIKKIEQAFQVDISCKDSINDAGNEISITGEKADFAYDAITALLKIIKTNGSLSDQNIDYVIQMVNEGKKEDLSFYGSECIAITNRGKPIRAKTIGQKKYVDSIKNNTIVFGVGPAGTGKTFLAVSMAVTALRNKEVNRIILTRPAVEAGEKLGYLPGDLQSKIDPYLRPLYDALYEMIGSDSFQRYMEKGTIEIAPLAYMRGRTLDDSFIILDEAQNTSAEQMKMFLTRLGFNSKMVITGDITQIDLPYGKRSGLIEACKILKEVEDIKVHYFTEKDVVRHRLVQQIIKAYESKTEKKTENSEI